MTCRICLEDGELIQPCDCRGSSAHVHEKCLIKWLQVSKRTDCEICHFQYDITEVEETRHVACPGCSFGDSNSANTVVFLVGIMGHFVMMFFMSAQMFVSTTEDFFIYANLLQGFMLLFLHAKIRPREVLVFWKFCSMTCLFLVSITQKDWRYFYIEAISAVILTLYTYFHLVNEHKQTVRYINIVDRFTNDTPMQRP